MVTISDLSCIGNDGKRLHGTAAVLHRLFGNIDEQAPVHHEREMSQAEYEKIVTAFGYWTPSND